MGLEDKIKIVAVGIKVDEEIVKLVDGEVLENKILEEEDISAIFSKRPVHWAPLLYTCQ